MFARYGAWIYRHRRAAVVCWLLVFALSLLFAVKIQTVLTDPPFAAEQSDSAAGEKILQERLSVPQETLVLVAQDRQQGRITASDRQTLQVVAERLRQISAVQSVMVPGVAQISGDTAYLTVGLNADLDQARQLLPKLRAVIGLIMGQEMKWQLAGNAPFVEAEDRASVRDLSKVEIIALPITLLVLLLSFGTWLAASLPLLTSLAAAVVSLAILYGLGRQMEMSVFVLNIPTTVGIAVGIDYSLLLVSRFREELRARSVAESVARTLATSGRSIFYSGLLVMLGVLSLGFFDAVVFRSVMVGGLVVVAMTMIGALTLIPALLGLFGERINRANVWRWTQRLDRQPIDFQRFWAGFARWVMRHAVAVLLLVFCLLLALISPMRHVHFGVPGLEALPAADPARQAMEALEEKFGQHTFEPLTVVLEQRQGNILQNEQGVQTLRQYVEWIQKQKEVGRVTSFFSLFPQTAPTAQVEEMLLNVPEPLRRTLAAWVRNNVAQVRVDLRIDPDDPQAVSLLERIKQRTLPGFQVYVTGVEADHHNFDASVLKHLPFALWYVFGVTFALLMFVFRSVVLPLKALLMNAVSLLAAFGVLSWIFVEGHGLAFLHVGTATSIDTFVPVFVFAFLFGTSMDYEVFMLARIQEEHQAGLGNEEATAKGLAVNGRLISAAALVLFLHTGAFSLTDVLPVKQIGMGLAIAIAIDATLVRLFLVPALMKLLGDWNWKFFKLKKGV